MVEVREIEVPVEVLCAVSAISSSWLDDLLLQLHCTPWKTRSASQVSQANQQLAEVTHLFLLTTTSRRQVQTGRLEFVRYVKNTFIDAVAR